MQNANGASQLKGGSLERKYNHGSGRKSLLIVLHRIRFEARLVGNEPISSPMEKATHLCVTCVKNDALGCHVGPKNYHLQQHD